MVYDELIECDIESNIRNSKRVYKGINRGFYDKFIKIYNNKKVIDIA